MADLINCGSFYTFEELLAASIGVDAEGHPYLRQLATTNVCESKLFSCAIPFSKEGLVALFGLDACGDIAMRVSSVAEEGESVAVISQFGSFYGLTAGTGNGGATDYAATVAVKTAAGTGRVPFPRDGAASGIARVNSTSFTLPDIGTYKVTYNVHTTEPGQLQIELNGVDLPDTVASNDNPTSGGHPIGGTFFVTTTVVNEVLAIVNPTGNTPALTITPADGTSTHAHAQVLTIEKIA